jgi:hypothetical protein
VGPLLMTHVEHHRSFPFIVAVAPIALFSEIDRTFVIRPVYYAMLLFNIALAGPNSRVYSPKSSSTTLRIKTWAIQNAETNEYTLVVIHKGTGEAVTLTVPAPMAGAKARSVNMTAPSLTSKSGFAISGAVVDGQTGAFAGPIAIANYKANAQGWFRFTVAPGSAMVIRFSKDVKQPFIRLQSENEASLQTKDDPSQQVYVPVDQPSQSPSPSTAGSKDSAAAGANAGQRIWGLGVLLWNAAALGAAIVLAW